jgi:serine/threonine protein kinase/tetratricopeptide (TPR) repeat protein
LVLETASGLAARLRDPQAMIGKSLSHYVVLEELHRGEMQIVFRARDEKLGREVALKVLPPELGMDPERRQRFLAEAKASAALEHPHIGVIHEIDEADGVVFIAMELLRGSSLAARIAEKPLAPVEAVDIAIGVGAGLAYAHERGIIHRDVKPGNVMLGSEGFPKLIDFGLAKLLDVEQSPFLNQAGDDDLLLQGATREGVIQGTVSFMSPEQARGGRVDQRSDIFSFGLLLYTMVTGRPPFAGTSRIDTLHAILRDPTPKLGGISSEDRELLQPIVDRCLQKEPDRRYGTMTQVLEDLRRVRRKLDTSQGRGRFTRRALLVAAAVGGLVLLAFTMFPSAPPPVDERKPSIAIFPFENLTGDPGLDWLRTGLPDMLVTDLSQAPELEVIGLDRVSPALEGLRKGREGAIDRETLARVAGSVGVESVLVGSFARAGEVIRISARLEDASTGRVLLSEKAEASGDENLFRLVDEITGRIKTRFEIKSPPGGELDRDLRDVTTSSVEAYREYAEGIRLHERYREEEAVPHFQKAIELDPGFAMALAKLGIAMSNIGLDEEADGYAERALEHVDRLTERERYYIEGWYYSRKPETIGKAIAAYRKAIELYPDHGSARHNLGNLLFGTERYDEAIEQLEELRRRGMLFPATYEELAMAYKAIDDVDSARKVLTDYSEKNPDDWNTVLGLAQIEIETGDIAEGQRALDRAQALGATPTRLLPIRWEADVLRQEWTGAQSTADALLKSDASREKFLGGRLAATTALYRGRYRSVLEGIDGFVAGARNQSSRLQPLLFKAQILLEVGDYQEAKETALQIAHGQDAYGVSQKARVIAAIAASHLGEREEANELAREYQRGIDAALGPAPERLYHFLEGELEMAHGRFTDAVAQLNEAESMLPPRGAEGVHTLIWYSLATAHRKAGNASEANNWYQRILDSSEERLFEPIRYVRSFYYLAELEDESGDHAAARANYELFVSYWDGGEIDRELVDKARARLR